MSTSTQDLRFRLLGEDAGASKTMGKVAKGSDDAHAALGRLAGQLSSIGGPFAVAQEAYDGIAGGLEHIHEHGKTVGSVLTGVGIAATGAGVLLTQFGAKDQQAQAQLQASVRETGNSWGAFKGKIEETVTTEEHYGRTADDTQNALNNLTIALQDPNKALQEMAVVTDLAAQKHESLAAASDTLIKAQEGNAKAFRSLGIVLDGNGTKTEQINRALDEMSKRLSGQASAAADTFSGRLQAWKAHAEDVLSSMSKYAPILTAIGPAAALAGSAISYLTKSREADVAVSEAADAAAQQELANSTAIVAAQQDEVASTGTVIAAKQGEVAATVEVVAAEGREITANSALAASNIETGASESAKGALAGVGGKLVPGAGVGIGIYAAGQVAKSQVHGGAGSAIGDVANGAAAGALVGSVVPGVGTAVGAGGGAVLGALHAALSSGGGGVNPRYAHGVYQNAKSLNEESAAAKKSAAASDEAAHKIEAIGQAAVKAKAALDTEIASLHKHADAALQAGGTADAFHKALNDLKDAADKNTKTLRGTSDAAITNRDAVRNLAQAELAHIDALQKQGADSVTVRDKSLEMSRQLEKQATAVFGNKEQVDRLLGSMHLLPSQIKTEIKVDPADKAKRTLAALNAQIDALAGMDHIVNVQIRQHGGKGAKASLYSHGGFVTGGVPGRDSVSALLTPGEFVVRADRSNLRDVVGAGGGSMPAASGGGGSTIITVEVNGMTRDGARELDKVLRQLHRETGGALGYG